MKNSLKFLNKKLLKKEKLLRKIKKKNIWKNKRVKLKRKNKLNSIRGIQFQMQLLDIPIQSF